jgi:CRP/FNR family transcriptional regulator, cyclic AMP receptor protein
VEESASANRFAIFRNVDSTVGRRAGEVVFSSGDPADVLYVVRSGEVAVMVGSQEVERLGEGGMFGEMALIDEGPRSATVVAATDCELIPIDRPTFRHLVQEAPFFAENVMKVMAERLRRVAG